MVKKNLLVWKELMKQTGFDDESLFEELTQGFRLCGQSRASEAFFFLGKCGKLATQAGSSVLSLQEIPTKNLPSKASAFS